MISKIDPEYVPLRMKIFALLFTFFLALVTSISAVADVTIILIALARFK